MDRFQNRKDTRMLLKIFKPQFSAKCLSHLAPLCVPPHPASPLHQHPSFLFLTGKCVKRKVFSLVCARVALGKKQVLAHCTGCTVTQLSCCNNDDVSLLPQLDSYSHDRKWWALESEPTHSSWGLSGTRTNDDPVSLFEEQELKCEMLTFY